MKTKHKLKLLSILPKGFQEYEDLRKSLFLEAMGNTTEIQKPEIETKSESITERFNEGDYAEIIWDSLGHDYNTGEIVRILGDSEFNPINYKCVNKRNKVRYCSPKDIKKIPIQKENPKEFKVGDKVRVIKGENITKHFFNDGDIVVINELENDPTHGLCAYCNGDTTNQWVSIKELEHI